MGFLLRDAGKRVGCILELLGELELSNGCSFFIRRSSKCTTQLLLDMDDCANRDVW